jgi:hypothetical protein
VLLQVSWACELGDIVLPPLSSADDVCDARWGEENDMWKMQMEEEGATWMMDVHGSGHYSHGIRPSYRICLARFPLRLLFSSHSHILPILVFDPPGFHHYTSLIMGQSRSYHGTFSSLVSPASGAPS